MKPHDIYQDVTNTIIDLLETHQKENFSKPWIALGADNDFARNPSTGNYYRGINQFLLSYKLMKKSYLSNEWMTFNQIKTLGGTVKKGEKSTPVIFYKTAFIDQHKKYYSPQVVEKMSDAKARSLGIDAVPILKLYRVFNLFSQTENLPDHHYELAESPELTPFEKDDRAENLIHSTGASIDIRQSNAAYYDVQLDRIILPLREQFQNQTQNFYAVALHELGHWTGAKHRLNRTMGRDFGDQDYAREELIAELTSAYCCARLGFAKPITQNAAYLKSWLTILKSDSKAIVAAASSAQKAADFIYGEVLIATP